MKLIYISFPIHYNNYKYDEEVDKYINPHEEKYEEIRNLYNYKKYLKEVKGLIYSGEIYKNSDGFESEVEVKIKEDETLSKVQKRYLLIKISSYEHSTLCHNYIWKLNPSLRKITHAYRYTMDKILRIADMEKKARLINKLYKSLKYDYNKDIISYGTTSMVALYLMRDARDCLNDKKMYEDLKNIAGIL